MKVIEYIIERMRDRNHRGAYVVVDDAREPLYVDAGSWLETQSNIDPDEAQRIAMAAAP